MSVESQTTITVIDVDEIEVAVEMAPEEAASWCTAELGAVHLGDHRLDVRLGDTAAKLTAQPLAPIHQAGADWADTKAS